MKLELEGKEPLWILIGTPFLVSITTALLLAVLLPMARTSLPKKLEVHTEPTQIKLQIQNMSGPVKVPLEIQAKDISIGGVVNLEAKLDVKEVAPIIIDILPNVPSGIKLPLEVEVKHRIIEIVEDKYTRKGDPVLPEPENK